MDRHKIDCVLSERPEPSSACLDAVPLAARFPPEQRRLLLLQSGLGEGVLKRLEAAGYASIEALRAEGVQEVIDNVSGCASRGAMRNRCRALERAITAWSQHCSSTSSRVNDRCTLSSGTVADVSANRRHIAMSI